jgi:hypothetical protein
MGRSIYNHRLCRSLLSLALVAVFASGCSTVEGSEKRIAAGAFAGACIGAFGGPIGAGVGAGVGAIAGALTPKTAAEVDNAPGTQGKGTVTALGD